MDQHGKGKCVRESWTDFRTDGMEGCSLDSEDGGWTDCVEGVAGVKL